VDKAYMEVPGDRLGEALTVSGFLATVGLEQLEDIFDREKITMDILVEMNHDDLKEIGITAYGHRHKIIKGIEKLLSAYGMFNMFNMFLCLHFMFF
jgi:tankyrase